jgi:hypothetical protein
LSYHGDAKYPKRSPGMKKRMILRKRELKKRMSK